MRRTCYFLGSTARPARLKQKLKNALKQWVGRGGLVITPAYDLEIKVKWENVLAHVRPCARGLEMERLPESAISAVSAEST